MRNINRITLLGNVGAAPEVRVTETGKSVVNFRLATTERFTDSSGTQREVTEWHRIVAWDQLADLVGQYVGRGDPLFVEGVVRTRKWQDDSGADRWVTEIHVQHGNALVFLPRGATPAGTPPQPPADPQPTAA